MQLTVPSWTALRHPSLQLQVCAADWCCYMRRDAGYGACTPRQRDRANCWYHTGSQCTHASLVNTTGIICADSERVGRSQIILAVHSQTAALVSDRLIPYARWWTAHERPIRCRSWHVVLVFLNLCILHIQTLSHYCIPSFMNSKFWPEQIINKMQMNYE